MDTPCAYCHGSMEGRVRERAKFCSVTCKDTARNEARRRAVIAARPERACRWCGSAIEADRHGQAMFCSSVCSWKFQNKRNAAERKAGRRRRRQPCAYCGESIPPERRAGVIYCSVACKANATSARWRERSPGYMRQYLYGITPEQFIAMLASQDGRCAICRTDKPGGKGGWHVDHDHESKAVRGLLCHYCNLALGNFADDPDRLRAAVAYLERASV